MNSPSQPSPDDLDRAFSQFFRAQMPARWPAPPIPVDAQPSPASKATGPWRTRLTLGASVAALLALGFAVSYGPGVTAPPKGNGFDKTGQASGDGIHKHMKDDVPPMEMMP